MQSAPIKETWATLRYAQNAQTTLTSSTLPRPSAWRSAPHAATIRVMALVVFATLHAESVRERPPTASLAALTALTPCSTEISACLNALKGTQARAVSALRASRPAQRAGQTQVPARAATGRRAASSSTGLSVSLTALPAPSRTRSTSSARAARPAAASAATTTRPSASCATRRCSSTRANAWLPAPPAPYPTSSRPCACP